MKYQAILFDLDGTLIHTTHLYERACIAGMQAVGLSFSAEDFRRLYPKAMGMASWISEKGGDPARLEEVRAARDIVYHDLLAKESSFIDGSIDVLDAVKGHSGVVTNSWRTYLDAIHRCIKLYDHIDHVITADDMGEFYKPHPHGLLLAADKIGVDPKKCLYVGDQSFDLTAGHAAGMDVCLIHGPHTPPDIEKQADMVVRSLQELRVQAGI